uniref:Uncharacterized protein n=1 Tax=Lepeophtheirus salmonis TaxID=72036 RepID=A0A0K2V6Z3_LEPSM
MNPQKEAELFSTIDEPGELSFAMIHLNEFMATSTKSTTHELLTLGDVSLCGSASERFFHKLHFIYYGWHTSDFIQ